jgi:hypothetical protein
MAGFSRTDYILAVGLVWLAYILDSIRKHLRGIHSLMVAHQRRVYPEDFNRDALRKAGLL